MIELNSIRNNVIERTREVGEFIRKEHQNFDRARIEQKEGISNLVSYVDKKAEEMIVSSLQKILPGSGIIGEEGTNIKSENEYEWIIDPLDGTTNFIHGMPLFAISIGMVKSGKLVLGVILEINSQECFHAIVNDNAYCNQKIIHVSPTKLLSESLFATGFPYYDFPKRENYMNVIKHLLDHTHGMRRLGSAAVDLAFVACGRLEGFFEYNLNPWDVAAGALIVQQAGGTVTDFRGGDDYLFGGEICAAGSIHGEMLKTIENFWNKR